MPYKRRKKKRKEEEEKKKQPLTEEPPDSEGLSLHQELSLLSRSLIQFKIR